MKMPTTSAQFNKRKRRVQVTQRQAIRLLQRGTALEGMNFNCHCKKSYLKVDLSLQESRYSYIPFLLRYIQRIKICLMPHDVNSKDTVFVSRDQVEQNKKNMQSSSLPQFISFCLYLHTYKFMRQKLSLSRENLQQVYCQFLFCTQRKLGRKMILSNRTTVASGLLNKNIFVPK